jgi:hypothetical protein
MNSTKVPISTLHKEQTGAKWKRGHTPLLNEPEELNYADTQTEWPPNR